MQNVSTSFDEKMSRNTRPPLVAEIEFRQLALGAEKDASITATGDHAISRPTQLVDDTPENQKYNSLETGGWLLDGEREILPDNIPQAIQIGEWSDELSDDNCEFAAPLSITASFSKAITSVGLTVDFDTAGHMYAPEFTIRAYNGATLQKTVHATADSPHCVVEEPLDNYDKLVIIISKWSQPRCRARVGEIRFGIIRIYGNKELVEFSVLNNIDPVNRNTAAGEIAFAFDNRDGKFDFGNPTGIYRYVVVDQEVVARIGFPGEMVQVSKNKISSWASNDGKASMRALDALNVANCNFADATYTNQSLATICNAALSQAGISDYSLDSNLGNFTVSVELKNTTCLSVLKWAATAARLTLYVDYTGKLIIGMFPIEVQNYSINYSNSPKPACTMDKPLKSVSVDYKVDGKTQTVSKSYASYGREIKVVANPFITTEALAKAVLEWEATYYQRRKNYRSDWRQNPKIESGDNIKVQNDYGTPTATVLSQRYAFSGGGLCGQTVSKGV